MNLDGESLGQGYSLLRNAADWSIYLPWWLAHHAAIERRNIDTVMALLHNATEAVQNNESKCQVSHYPGSIIASKKIILVKYCGPFCEFRPGAAKVK